MNRHFCPLRQIPPGVGIFMLAIAIVGILAAIGSVPS